MPRGRTRPAAQKQSETTAEKVRNVSPVRINEFRISSGPPANSTDSFIELYNAGDSDVDISNWTLTEHPTQQAIFSAVKIPAGTKLAAHGFYLLGLSNSGLAVPARAGDTTIHVRSTAGMSAGDTISIGTGSDAETRKIASVGTAASTNTTLWQPLPDGPVITIPAGSTNVPVTSVAGFAVGAEDRPRLWRHLSRRRADLLRSTRWPRSPRSASRARKPIWGRRARRRDQHQSHVGRQHLGRRQDQAGHRQRRPWHRDRHGHARRHAGDPHESLGDTCRAPARPVSRSAASRASPQATRSTSARPPTWKR